MFPTPFAQQILDWFVQITLALKHVHDKKVRVSLSFAVAADVSFSLSRPPALCRALSSSAALSLCSRALALCASCSR